MPDESWADLNRWKNETIADSKGRIAICFGLSATWYFSAGHSEGKRRAVLDCFNEYEQIVRPALTWHAVGAEVRQFHRVAALKSRDMSPYLLSPKWQSEEAREHGWAFYWHGGERKEDASPFSIRAYGSPRSYFEMDGSLSFLKASFPVDFFDERRDSLPELALRWSDRILPEHGYGGISLLYSPDRGVAQRFSVEIGHFGERYPGIEIDRPMSHKLETVDSIKGGNWITILSDKYVKRLDDRIGALESPFSVLPYRGGVVIQAGNAPQVGDRNRQIDLPLYEQLSAVLRPIRTKRHRAVFPRGLYADPSNFEAWLDRFDLPSGSERLDGQ